MPIELDFPVTVGGQEYKSLTMRRPKVRDQKAAEKGAASDADAETMLFANLCDVPPEVIDELDMLDYAKVQKEYKGFLSGTGKRSAPPAP